MESEQCSSTRVFDNTFIASSLIFNILIGGIWLTAKLGNTVLLGAVGALFICLIAPFTFVLWGYRKARKEGIVIASLLIILFYLFLELLLDFILRIPFRDIPVLHAFYIVVLYAATFNIIGISFRINRRMGFAVTITFWISLVFLVYMYLG